MAPITCRLPSGATSATCRRAIAQATTTTQSRSASAAAPVASAFAGPQTSRNLTTSSSSRISPQQQQQQRQSLLRPQFQATTTTTTRTRTTTPTTTSSRRPYHSYDHPSPQTDDDPFFSPTERAILTAAYAHVPEHGFTHKALALGARDAGYLDISTNVLPDGVFSLVLWHLAYQREGLALKSKVLFSGSGGEGAGERLGVGRKVEMLTWERLMGNKAVVGRWQEALAIMAQPSYVPASLKELAKLSDEIWFLVGDTAADPSWYTKRASLSATYASAELFMTTDRSEGFVETRRFLRRRLEEVQGVGGSLRSLGQWVGFTASAGLNVLRSKGVRV